MHEFSLAQSIADLVSDSAREVGIAQIRRVTVVVGEWSAVLPEALSTSFAAIAVAFGPPLEGAAMAVLHQRATGRCKTCGEEFAVGERGLVCPTCGGIAAMAAGTEFYVDSYEGE